MYSQLWALVLEIPQLGLVGGGRFRKRDHPSQPHHLCTVIPGSWPRWSIVHLNSISSPMKASRMATSLKWLWLSLQGRAQAGGARAARGRHGGCPAGTPTLLQQSARGSSRWAPWLEDHVQAPHWDGPGAACLCPVCPAGQGPLGLLSAFQAGWERRGWVVIVTADSSPSSLLQHSLLSKGNSP